MPKMKTKKSAAKRYTKRSPKRKRNLRAAGYVAEADAKKIRKQMLPYG